jgi:hypothetical protein
VLYCDSQCKISGQSKGFKGFLLAFQLIISKTRVEKMVGRVENMVGTGENV